MDSTSTMRLGWTVAFAILVLGDGTAAQVVTPEPTPSPSPAPSPSPTPAPSPSPTPAPSPSPTPAPSPSPSPAPSPSPTPAPTHPTPSPSPAPSPSPTPGPTPFPSPYPTPAPTPLPTPSPSPAPSPSPTPGPTPFPSPGPTPAPTPLPTELPSSLPTESPTTVEDGWTVDPCLIEDRCSESELSSIIDAINNAYENAPGRLADDDELNMDPSDDDDVVAEAEQCLCENSDPYEHSLRRSIDSNINLHDVLHLGHRTIHFRPPAEFGSSRDTSSNRDKRSHRVWADIRNTGAIYNGGNYITTSLCGGQSVLENLQDDDGGDPDDNYITYRTDDTCAVSTSCFGNESTYRMSIDTGRVQGSYRRRGTNFMHLRASVTADDPDFYFLVSGNLEAGAGNTENFTLVSTDGDYVGFAWQTCNGPSSWKPVEDDDDRTSDPSVNHLVIVKNGPTTHQRVARPGGSVVPDRDDDDFGVSAYFQLVSGIPKGPLSYYMWYGKRNFGADTCWSESDFQTVFNAAIGTSCTAFDCSNTKVCSTGCGEKPSIDNCTNPGATTSIPTGAPSTAPSEVPSAAPTPSLSPSVSPTTAASIAVSGSTGEDSGNDTAVGFAIAGWILGAIIIALLVGWYFMHGKGSGAASNSVAPADTEA